jgi:hypothetical protein
MKRQGLERLRTACKPGFKLHTTRLEKNPVEIIAIGYDPNGRVNCVTTLSERNANGYRCPQVYLFDWCRRDGAYYQHNSGGGGDGDVHIGSWQKDPIGKPSMLWVAEDVSLTCCVKVQGQQRWVTAPAVESDLERCHVRLLKVPRLVRALLSTDFTTDPFESAFEEQTHTTWCAKCRDYLPDESLCRHLTYCETCGETGPVIEHEGHEVNQ